LVFIDMRYAISSSRKLMIVSISPFRGTDHLSRDIRRMNDQRIDDQNQFCVIE
jgi:hypothetical protein